MSLDIFTQAFLYLYTQAILWSFVLMIVLSFSFLFIVEGIWWIIDKRRIHKYESYIPLEEQR